MTYQSLYRRYRPRRFSELKGQEHVVRALRTAVADGRVGQAFLFSGPRGTGKTTTARILAKALNCTNLHDGEPCCECDSCKAVEAGTSFDVHELDAASNNGVDEIRDLVASAALGTPGRSKVYVLDEVHMLSKAASNALLKTLEEPPAHVRFVLATTDPQKVLPTIRSRCQHYEFHLLAATELAAHVRWVIADAGLDVSDDTVDAVVRHGGGSARDTLSALELAAAGGGLDNDNDIIDVLIDALINNDTAAALVALANAIGVGRDPRTLAEDTVAALRDRLLSILAPEVVQLPDLARARAIEQGQLLGAARTVRAMEVFGSTLIELRHAPDPRVLLDVALVRLTRPDADTSVAALLERIERLERLDRSGSAAPITASIPHVQVPAAAPPAPPQPSRRPAATPPPPQPSAPFPAPVATSTKPAPVPAPATVDAGPLPGRDQLTLAWGDVIVKTLRPSVKALFLAGRFVSVENNRAVFALPNEAHRERCEVKKAEVEEALAVHFGRAVPLLLVADGALANITSQIPIVPAQRAEPPAEPEASLRASEVAALTNAPAVDPSGVDMLAAAFEGSEIIDPISN